ncbi:unnamed protein product [Rhizoctonia solani]|uniref:Uncharacterized protein n=1 Tax=Rhizoctonia solani TaxID=456999 RepID=A0A8H3ATI4_9AGAM|nr:unnamed protein product [Rhizoctonia solani]
MYKLTRAFVIAAASSSVLCAPIPKDVGEPIGTGRAADPSAPASRVFGTTQQEPNYQSHPNELCIVPALAKYAGLSQGQDQLNVKQAIQLCSEAKTISVSSTKSKRSVKGPNDVPPVPSPVPESHRDELHPARSVNEHPLNAEVLPKPAHEPLPGATQPHIARDLPPKPKSEPVPAPFTQSNALHPVAARSEFKKPPKVGVQPQQSSKPEPDGLRPREARDLPLHPVSEPQPVPQPPKVPQAIDHHPARSFEGHPPISEAPVQPSPQPEIHPDVPHPVSARSLPNPKAPSHPQPLPATLPRQSQFV